MYSSCGATLVIPRALVTDKRSRARDIRLRRPSTMARDVSFIEAITRAEVIRPRAGE